MKKPLSLLQECVKEVVKKRNFKRGWNHVVREDRLSEVFSTKKVYKKRSEGWYDDSERNIGYALYETEKQ